MANPLLIKLASDAGNSKGGRKVILSIIVFIFFLILLCITIITSMVSVFLGYGITDNFEEFQVKDTDLYSEIKEIYEEYEEIKRQEIQQMADAISKKYTYYEEEWYCSATIYTAYYHISSAYTYAFLSCSKKEELLGEYQKPYHINKKELYDFWDSINILVCEETGDSTEEKPIYNIYNKVLDAEEIADLYFKTDKDLFLESVYMISRYVGTDFEDDYYYVENANRMGIPLYYQYDSPWGTTSYGNGTISKKGCAPTCIAMVVSYLKQSNIYPHDITAYTKNNYYVDGVGSSWAIFSACAAHWEMNCTEIGRSSNKIAEELSKKHPVILSMGPGLFTSSGHFIVLTGITEEGKVYVNDPNDNNKKNHVEKEFPLSQIMAEAKGGWSFY